MVQLVIFLPLFAAAITGLLYHKASDWFAGYFNSILVTLAAILSYFIFYNVIFLHINYSIPLFEWLSVGSFKVNWSIYIDSITAVMLVVVNTVSALVHFYSIGYMSGDRTVPKFMSFISLFTFFMLMLVTSDNLLQLFFGWEGVGLCSYLLIGYWYKKESAYNAAIKAFIVNRVGDIFFAMAIFAIFSIYQTIYFKEIFANAGVLVEHYINVFGMQINAANFVCVLLFIGCMGKSAQLGLHTWLPDAMEGPTPISALIHAATMVTVGVFVVARFSAIFEYSNFALEMMIFIGATTAFITATIALAQDDIKKIIAYSTCSQLGYMFFACGVSAYSIGIFHLMTHAFFKSLLFLGAGSVIHALSDEQNIFKMGGLMKKIPFTFAMMLIGSLAISGIPPFAGYFSKDAILEAAYASNRIWSNYAYICGVLGAFCTAFYSWRLLIIVFHGQPMGGKENKKVHEPSLSMSVPLSILAFGSVFAGIAGYKLGMIDSLNEFWHGSIAISRGENIFSEMHHIAVFAKILPLILTLAGIISAYVLYMYSSALKERLLQYLSSIYKVAKNKYYFDELYNIIFVKPYKYLAKFAARKIDLGCIDLYGPNGAAKFTKLCSHIICKVQTGFLYHYAFVMIFGLLLILSWVIFIIL